MSVKLYLYDDDRARRWEPFALTRPVGELLFGCLLLRERIEAAWRVPCVGHVTRSELEGFEEAGAPGVVPLDSLDRDDVRVLLNSRAVLRGSPMPSLEQAATLTIDGRVAGWILPSGAATPPESALRSGAGSHPEAPEAPVAGFFLDDPWDLVAENGSRIEADLSVLGYPAMALAEGIHVLGNGGVHGAEGAQVEPGVVLDTRDGPVILDTDARIQGPARVTGPVYVGRGSVVLGGVVANTSIGATCKVRGEVADSVITGFCNKAHDGHLGHALLGRWVNLGAFTTNSDLKNTYGPVRVERSDGVVDTGRTKVGCFIGDHVRTGIGTLLNTGAVLGAGSTVFGGGLAPKFVPPFSWASSTSVTEVRFDRFLEAASRMMERRDQELTPGLARLWKRAFERTRGQRAGDAEIR